MSAWPFQSCCCGERCGTNGANGEPVAVSSVRANDGPHERKLQQVSKVFHPKESEDLDGDSLQSSHAAKRWEESRLAAMLNAKILAETAATSEPPETHEFSQGTFSPDVHDVPDTVGAVADMTPAETPAVEKGEVQMPDVKQFQSFLKRSPDERDRLALIMARFASAEVRHPSTFLQGSSGLGFGHEKLGQPVGRKRMDVGVPKGLLPIVGTWKSPKTKCYYFYFDLHDRSDIEFPGSSLAIEHWRSDELIRLETAILFHDVNADAPMGFGRLTDAKKASVDEFEDGDGIVIPSITGDRHQFGSLTFEKNLRMFRKQFEIATPSDVTTPVVPTVESPKSPATPQGQKKGSWF